MIESISDWTKDCSLKCDRHFLVFRYGWNTDSRISVPLNPFSAKVSTCLSILLVRLRYFSSSLVLEASNAVCSNLVRAFGVISLTTSSTSSTVAWSVHVLKRTRCSTLFSLNPAHGRDSINRIIGDFQIFTLAHICQSSLDTWLGYRPKSCIGESTPILDWVNDFVRIIAWKNESRCLGVLFHDSPQRWLSIVR